MTRWWRSIWCAGEGEEVNGFLNCFLASDAAHSDAIDLTGFDAASTVFTEKSVSGNLVLTATDGDKVATLTFDHVDGAPVDVDAIAVVPRALGYVAERSIPAHGAHAVAGSVLVGEA